MNAFTPEFRADMAVRVRELRATPLTWVQIGVLLGLCPETCRQIYWRAEWPKVVTRIGRDGTAMIIRTE